MKTLQRLSMMLVFILVLATSVAAGEIPIDKTPPPPPTASSTATAPGEIPIDDRFSAPETDSSESSSITEIAVSFVQIMLSVF